MRHGSNEGFVELDFTVEENKVVIRRTLKRSSKSITQDSGIITINGDRQELTPVELKSKILELKKSGGFFKCQEKKKFIKRG